MNWILASLLMFFSSAFMYVLVRKGQKLGVTTMVNSLAMFALPVPFLYIYARITHGSLSVTPYQLLILFFTSLFLSWLGNLFSLKSIESSPNPGYSLILSKSYVVFTSVASVFLFSSKLSIKNGFGIVLILLFSALIILSDKRKEKEVRSLRWAVLALGAFFCWGGLALVSKYLLNLGVSVAARLFYVFFFVTLILAAESFFRKEKIVWTKAQGQTLFAVGILGMLFNLFMQLGIQTAPNPGFINAVNTASIALVAVLSAYFFKDDFNLKKMIGVLGILVGLLFLFL